MNFSHETIEKNSPLLIVLIILVIAVGGLVEIVPLYFQRSTTEAVAGLAPYTPVQLAGRDVYVREGCYNCHSQMIRPFRADTERYRGAEYAGGASYTRAGEMIYDRPFLWGSKRTGPDLARVGGRYSDDWHRIHLNNPRALVPESNMPAYSWLAKTPADATDIEAKLKVLRTLGHPYSDEDVAGARKALEDKNEQDVLIAYLQVLGVTLKAR